MRKGFIATADSLGAAARFGNVTFRLTADARRHSEMFPLLQTDQKTLELFQIWLTTRGRKKWPSALHDFLVGRYSPHLSWTPGRTTESLYRRQLPRRKVRAVFARRFVPATLPRAYGIKMARIQCRSGSCEAATLRNLYFFKGARVTVAGKAITEHAALELRRTSHGADHG